MNFAGVGPAELLVILIIALLVFGPTKLPEVARDIGKAMQKWRQALDEITQDTVSRTGGSAVNEADMQAAVQKVLPGTHEDDTPGADRDEAEDTEVETQCQT